MVKVSIIIAMYNESEYISRCMESLRDQTYTDFEVILIDDGSTDDSISKAEKYLSLLPLTILQQKYDKTWKKRNKWPASARNRWVENCHGEIIMIVDADMYFDKNYVKELVTPILNWEEVGTAHGVEKIWNPENKRAQAWAIDRIPNPQPRWWVYRALLKSEFQKIWWFNTEKWYFDDDMKKINNWKWAKTIMSAICYHNNPTTLAEAFDHSTWVWWSLLKQKDTMLYVKKYIKWLIVLLIVFIAATVFLQKTLGWYLILIYALIVILWFEAIALKRFINEKDYNYFYTIPILVATRIAWYSYWILYSLSKL